MSLLIKGGDIVDGKGAAPRKGDVLLIGDRVAAIGSLASYKADRVIQASGCFVVPGFIDVASGADRRLSIFSDRGQEETLSQGVTTAVGGCDGVSLAPIIYGSIDSMSPWARKEGININWRTVGEMIDALSETRFGVNFISFAGYKTVRSSISGRKRGLGKTESAVMANLVLQAVSEGMIGISLSSDEVSSNEMSGDEEKALIASLKGSKGAVSARLPVISKKAGEEVKKALRFADFGISTIVNGFGRAAVSERELDLSLHIAESMRSHAFISMSMCPSGFDEISLMDVLPEQVRSEDPAETLSLIGKKRGEGAVQKLWPLEKLSKLWIADSPKTSFLRGKNVADFAANRELSPAECFSELIRISGGNIVFYVDSERGEVFEKALIAPRVMVESGAYGGMSVVSEMHSTMTSAYRTYFSIADRRGVRMENAVEKVTSLPAVACGLKKRGTIDVGSFADVVVMNDKRADHVIVGGRIAVTEGEVTGERGGRFIRRDV